MKTVNIQIGLYSFNELSNESKQLAILEHGNLLNSLPQEFEDEDGKMVSEYIDHSDEEIIDNILANPYYFFENGELAKTCTYVGKHQKAGVTEFTFMGNTYEI